MHDAVSQALQHRLRCYLHARLGAEYSPSTPHLLFVTSLWLSRGQSCSLPAKELGARMSFSVRRLNVRLFIDHLLLGRGQDLVQLSLENSDS
jgi:hypothetical protein